MTTIDLSDPDARARAHAKAKAAYGTPLAMNPTALADAILDAAAAPRQPPPGLYRDDTGEGWLRPEGCADTWYRTGNGSVHGWRTACELHGGRLTPLFDADELLPDPHDDIAIGTLLADADGWIGIQRVPPRFFPPLTALGARAVVGVLRERAERGRG